jgi:hypothetical protein
MKSEKLNNEQVREVLGIQSTSSMSLVLGIVNIVKMYEEAVLEGKAQNMNRLQALTSEVDSKLDGMLYFINSANMRQDVKSIIEEVNERKAKEAEARKKAEAKQQELHIEEEAFVPAPILPVELSPEQEEVLVHAENSAKRYEKTNPQYAQIVINRAIKKIAEMVPAIPVKAEEAPEAPKKTVYPIQNNKQKNRKRGSSAKVAK